MRALAPSTVVREGSICDHGETMESCATVTVMISTYNEESHIDRCLDAVLAQTVPVSVIVIDGGSSDRTVERLKSRASRDARIRIHADGIRRTLPAALNLALTMCDAAYVAKVDARTFIASDFIERALDVFRSEGAGVACAGGRPEQFGETRFGEGVARARTSRFGVGGSGYADQRTRADVDTVQCGVYRCAAVREVGGFDPDLQFGEDEELNWRLRRKGYRIVLDTNIRFEYLTRSTWVAAFRQYRNYGRARARVVSKHPDFLRPRHLAPSLALVAVPVLLCAAPISRPVLALFASLAAIYCSGALLAAASSSREWRTVPYTAAAFTALHFGYGIGLLEESIRRRVATT